MELLCENSQRALHIDCFRRKAAPQTYDWIPNVDQTRGDVNLGDGWIASAWNW